MTLVEIVGVLAPVLGAIGGGAKWLANRADAATAATNARIAAAEFARSTAQADFIPHLTTSAASSESRTARVVEVVALATAQLQANTAASNAQAAAFDRIADRLDMRHTSERIAAPGSAA